MKFRKQPKKFKANDDIICPICNITHPIWVAMDGILMAMCKDNLYKKSLNSGICVKKIIQRGD